MLEYSDIIITKDQARDLLSNLSAGFAFARFMVSTEGAHPAYVDFMRQNLAVRGVLMEKLGIEL